jgi:hypothetical protein
MFDSILDALGYAGDVLDKPGRAVRGVLSGKLDEAAAFVPFSDSLGLTDPGRRTSGRELLSSLGLDAGDGIGGEIAGFGAEVATDPLTLIGGGIGRAVGGRASRAAEAMGPRYGTTSDDLMKIVGDAGHKPDSSWYHMERLLADPNADRVLSEIPPGSTWLGEGKDALSLRTPTGDVLRLAAEKADTPGRIVHDSILGTTRAVDVPSTPGLATRVERSPFAEGVGSKDLSRRDPATMLTAMERLKQDMYASGLNFWDSHLGNAGFVGGTPKIIDPGAVRLLSEGAGAFNHTPGGTMTRVSPDKLGPLVPASAFAREAVTGAADPGPLMSRLLDFLGGPGRTREAIESGLSGPNFRNELMLAGGGLGSVGGAFGRAGRN